MLIRKDNQLKDTQREVFVFERRVFILIALVSISLFSIAVRYFNLQITEYELYRTASDRNRVHLQPIVANRGLIYDRNGVLLADNKPFYSLVIVPELSVDLAGTLRRVKDLIELSDTDESAFLQRLKRRVPYEAVPLRLRLSESEIAILAVHQHELPGVQVDARLARYYPKGSLFSHSLGYVGRISEEETRKLDQVSYRGAFFIGKVGIENQYESVLRGQVGYQNTETDAHGRVLRSLERVDPKAGKNLTLHLDSSLQEVAEKAMGNQRGALVAIDPLSGGILALVSLPTYDGNRFVEGISQKEFSKIRESKDGPLFNRAVQGQYPPGSTIKPAIGLAGLEAGLINADTEVADPGWYKLPGEDRLYRDWTLRIRGTGHAPRVNLEMAIAESCDVYFYDLARRLTIDGINNFVGQFGLGSRTGIDIPGEANGILPSAKWKRNTLGGPWFPGETLIVGIGQGYTLASPIQLANFAAIIATRGRRFVPNLVHFIGDERVFPKELTSVAAEDESWDLIHNAMLQVVHGERGSARTMSSNLKYSVAGKTGTAQVIGVAQGEFYDEDAVADRHRNHGLFIAFAPAEAPTIALAVIIENGGSSQVALPVAKAVIDSWLDEENKG